MPKKSKGDIVPGAEVQKLLEELTEKRQEIDDKLLFDLNLKEDLQRQLLQLTEDLEDTEIRLATTKKQKKKLDMSISETETAISKLEETAKKLGDTMAKMKKKK